MSHPDQSSLQPRFGVPTDPAFFVPFVSLCRKSANPSVPIRENPCHPWLKNFDLMFLAQIPTPPPGSIEAWLIPAAAVLSLVALAKKLLPARRSDESFATKAELNHELGAVRDKIDARFLTLTEKIDHLGTSINDRLAKLEAAVARVDERTKS